MTHSMAAFRPGHTSSERWRYRPLCDGGKRGPRRQSDLRSVGLIRELESNRPLRPTRGLSEQNSPALEADRRRATVEIPGVSRSYTAAVADSSTVASRKNLAASSGGVGLM